MNYLIDIRIHAGEYEKTTQSLIEGAKDREQAEKAAILGEAHDPTNLENDSGTFYGLGGEFAYVVRGVTEVPEADLAVLKRYMYANDASVMLSLEEKDYE
jgi:hypothetical protein